MRVLLLIHDLGVGGAETLVANLAQALRAAGEVPIVCGWSEGGPLCGQLSSSEIIVEPPIGGRSGCSRLFVLLRLAAMVRRHRIDLVHAHLSDSAFWALALRWLCGTPAVITHHSNNLTDNLARPGRVYALFRAWLLRFCARHADLNVAVSPSVLNRLAEAVPLSDHRVTLIPNGVRIVPRSSGDQTQDAARGSGRSDEEPLILYAGRLEPEKGIDLLIEAVPAVVAKLPRARVIVLGEGSLRRALMQRIQDLGIGAAVQLEGSVPDIGPWLERASIVAVPSRVEGLPMTVLEAMARGVPVLATDIPGNRDLIGAQEHGWLCNAESPTALAAALLSALQQGEVATGRASSALAMVSSHYSLDVMARRYLEAYGRVLAARKRIG